MSESFTRGTGVVCPACNVAELQARILRNSSLDNKKDFTHMDIQQYECPRCKTIFDSADKIFRDWVI